MMTVIPPTRVAVFLNLALTLLAALVIAGWFVQSPLSRFLAPVYQAIPLSTAVAFGLIGLASLASLRAQHALALFCSIAALIIGGGALWHLVSGQPLLSGLFFPAQYFNAPSEFMAPSTALGLVAISAARMLLAYEPGQKRRFLAVNLLAPAAMVLPLFALVRFFFGIDAVNGWSDVTRMPVPTALGFVVLGVALVLGARPAQKGSLLPWFGLLLLVLILALWQSLVNARTSEIRQATSERARYLATNWAERFTSATPAFERLALRTTSASEQQWQLDAEAYIKDFDYLAIARIHSGRLAASVGDQVFAERLMQQFTSDPCGAAHGGAWKMLDHPTDASDKLLLLVVMLQASGAGSECLVASWSLSSELAKFESIRLANKYAWEARVNKQVIGHDTRPGGWSLTVPLYPAGAGLSLTIEPVQSVYERNALPEWVLVFCIALACVILLALRLLVVARRSKAEVIRTQRALEAGLTLHQSILSNAPCGIVLTDHHGVIVKTNPVLEQLFGYSTAQLLGQSIELLVPHSQRSAHVNHLRSYHKNAPIKRKMAENRQVFGRKSNGDNIAVEINIVPVEIEGKAYSMAMVIDVEERLAWQRNITEQNQRFTLASSAAGIGVWQWDVATNQVTWDEQTFRIHGLPFSGASQTYTMWRSSLHPDDVQSTEQAIAQALNGTKNYDTEFRIIQPSGAVRIIKALATVVRDAAGNPEKMVGVILDVTDQRLNEQLLTDTANQLLEETGMRQAILDSANTAIISTDTNGVVHTFNPAAARLTGFSVDEVVGKQTPAIWHDIGEVVARAEVLSEELGVAIEPGFESFVAKARITREPDENEWTYIQKNGARRTVMLSVTAIRNSRDQVSAYLGLAVDVTERKLNEAIREEQANELRRINDELASFTYIASHDLKSPLRGIDQLATWIVEDAGDHLMPETAEHLRLMRTRINRMEMLLDDLLDYARVGRGDQKISLVSTRDLLTEIIDLTVTNPAIQVTLGDGFPTFAAKSAPLELVFRNLINNAVKHHNKPSGHIHIAHRELDSFHEFSVADDGPGIAPEHHARIFEMFQTLRPRDEVEGSGIGLAMVKKTLESVGGTIWLVSDGNNGSRFHFTWPKI